MTFDISETKHARVKPLRSRRYSSDLVHESEPHFLQIIWSHKSGFSPFQNRTISLTRPTVKITMSSDNNANAASDNGNLPVTFEYNNQGDIVVKIGTNTWSFSDILATYLAELNQPGKLLSKLVKSQVNRKFAALQAASSDASTMTDATSTDRSGTPTSQNTQDSKPAAKSQQQLAALFGPGINTSTIDSPPTLTNRAAGASRSTLTVSQRLAMMPPGTSSASTDPPAAPPAPARHPVQPPAENEIEEIDIDDDVESPSQGTTYATGPRGRKARNALKTELQAMYLDQIGDNHNCTIRFAVFKAVMDHGVKQSRHPERWAVAREVYNYIRAKHIFSTSYVAAMERHLVSLNA